MVLSLERDSRRSVDFPTPGSPVNRTTSPGMNPPPNTRSNSKIPVLTLFFTCDLIFAKGVSDNFFVFSLPDEALAKSGCSLRVLNSPQSGHLPNQDADP